MGIQMSMGYFSHDYLIWTVLEYVFNTSVCPDILIHLDGSFSVLQIKNVVSLINRTFQLNSGSIYQTPLYWYRHHLLSIYYVLDIKHNHEPFQNLIEGILQMKEWMLIGFYKWIKWGQFRLNGAEPGFQCRSE